MALTNKELKFINSLKYKKYRTKFNVFLAEGEKIIHLLLKAGMPCKLLVVEDKYFNNHKFSSLDTKTKIVVCNERYLKKLSNLKTHTYLIGVFDMKVNTFEKQNIQNTISFLYDDIQDPGNFGNIIRTAEWFGVQNIFCSKSSVDAYSPKVIQASMGAIAKVNIFYVALQELIKNFRSKDFFVYGTFLNGTNAFQMMFPKKGFILFGNEGHGISKNLENMVDKKIHIPAHKDLTITEESLNISTATTVVCTLLSSVK